MLVSGPRGRRPRRWWVLLGQRLRERRGTRVFDLGCGIGRHAHYLASVGFECAGVDASQAGLQFARERARSAGLQIEYRDGTFYDLPYPAQTFDAVIAWNVLYHGSGELARKAFAEIERVLRPGGLLVASMLSTRNAQYARGREVAPDTFVVDGDPGDKGHPHLYCNTRTLLALVSAFDILDLRDREQGAGAFHWEFTLERRLGELARAGNATKRE